MNRLALVVLLSLPLAGCNGCKQATNHTTVTQAINHPTVNAVSTIATTMPSARGDTVVVGRFFSYLEYAQEPMDDHNVRRHWCLTRFQVLGVEKGIWAQQEVSFVTDYVWPTPESGIVVAMAPDLRLPPARPETIWALYLDTTVTPAKLVYYEERSLVPPHNKFPVMLDSEPAAPKLPNMRRTASAERILPASDAFMASLGKARNKDYHIFRQAEQTETSYIVQTVSNPDKSGHCSAWVIKIDKTTGKAGLLWSVP